MAIFEYGGPPVDILDAKTATNNGDGTFGTAHDVPSVQLLSAQITVDTQELVGDGATTCTYTRILKATVQLRHGGIPRDAYTDIFGVSGYEYGVAPNRRHSRRFGPGDLPYFAIAGKAAAGDDGTGCTILFIPKCKVVSAPTLEFQSNTFSIPNMTMQAVADENYLNERGDGTVFEILEYMTAVPVTIPPLSYS